MRRVVGARRVQLIAQFIGESLMLSLSAFVIALALVLLLLPAFSGFVERDMHFVFSRDIELLVGLIGLALFVGIVSGSYPAFYVSSMMPTLVLKGRSTSGLQGNRLRGILIVGQYAVSIGLVIGSMIIYRQLQYIRNVEMGYDREHVVALQVRDESVGENYDLIKAELLRYPGISGVASSGYLPTGISYRNYMYGWEGSSEEEYLAIFNTGVGYDFLEVYDIELSEGRSFTRDFVADSAAYLINETAARALEWENAIGKGIQYEPGYGPVVGVMKDFHLHSLHQEIQPLMLYLDPEETEYISIKIAPNTIAATLDHIERVITRFTPYPFDYQFVDVIFDQMYRSERKLGQISGLFTLLALFIASLGLFGLAAYSAERRTKEIGVRKVLGASVPTLIVLLSNEFTRLVAVAFLVAIPVVYILMSSWLNNFAYRVEMGVVVFLAALGAVTLIAWLSVLYQAVKAARVNPVISLKHE